MYQFFNTSGPCVPGKHYLVNPQDRLLDFNKINGLIKEERYFILHAPRQTGKTTQIGVKRQRQFFGVIFLKQSVRRKTRPLD